MEKIKLFCKKHFKVSVLLFAFLSMLSISAQAQNVTISPSSGKLIAGLTYDSEVGFQNGWSSLWRHEQLPLTLTVSDKTDLTEGGLLKDPAGNISLDANQNLFVIMGGTNPTTYMSVSLPKGYRFTGYRMVLLNNVNGKTVNDMKITGQTKRMYETGSNFSTSNPLASTAQMGSSNDNNEYVIERTSMSSTDMGNNLYFNFYHSDRNTFYGATLKSFELFFTAEAPFTEAVAPTEASGAVNMVGAPFKTNKLDLGQIKPNTKNGKTYYSYNYANVKEAVANNILYQADAVVDGALPETAGAGMIQSVSSNGEYYYALGNNTYYVESPIRATTQDGTLAPVIYRITGAKVNYRIGDGIPATEDATYITYVNNGTTYYMGTSLGWSTTPTKWTRDSNGRIYNGNTYLRRNTFSGELTTTSRVNNATAFTITNNQITCKSGNTTYYIVYGNKASLSTSSNNAVTWTFVEGTPAVESSPYTLKVYATDGNEVYQTVNVTSGVSGTVELTGLNNDAIKFEVEGLEDGSQAFVTIDLTMEALDPFINTIDITCHSTAYDDVSIYQQFTSNDFQVAGGKFVFYVPSEFIGDTNNCRFTFDNLYSKYGDETYTDGNGHARYFFVKSPYYNTYYEKQYQTSGNEEASTKVSTAMCGNKAYKYSNIDELSNDNTGGATTTLEEYPYSEENYNKQGGTFSDEVVIAINENRKCYLFTGDETRWNIAPTTAMEHRHYAYYLMDIDLVVKDYNGVCELTKVYDTTCYAENGEDSEKAMYGAKFKAVDPETGDDIPETMSYLTSNMMTTALNSAVETAGITKNQILYLDFTGLYSVHVPVATEMDAVKSALNPNCLVYFPQTVNFNGDNYVKKTASGDFRACRNIVITDKNPFFVPYKITVPAENYATYTRNITTPKNGKVTSASIILPFTLALEDGVHTNKDGLCSFAVNKMNATNPLNMGDNGVAADYTAYFSPVDAAVAEANKPYVVEVVEAPTDKNISFIATQYGSDVVATKATMAADYTFAGETSTGSVVLNDVTTKYTFEHYGSFSGKKLAKGENVFYFAKNQFVSSAQLMGAYAYIYPFRCYYKADAALAKAVSSFVVEYGENPDADVTGIDGVSASDIDLAVIVGDGTITVESAKAQDVTIAGINGMSVARLDMQAGQSTTVNVPAGIYVVKGKKIIVK